MFEWLRWTDVMFMLVVVIAFAFAFTKCVRHKAVRSSRKAQRDPSTGRLGRRLNGSSGAISAEDLWE